MVSLRGSMALQLPLVAMVLLLSRVSTVEAVAAWALTDWGDAHATFYGGQDASGTMGGACGYGNLYSVGYGTSTAALSNAMFNSGLSCGACYEIVCKLEGSKYCYPGKSITITITATNSCPPGSEGGWCDPPRLHFDLSYPMFQKLAEPVGGVIPVKYKRVPCAKSGGIRFTIHGNPYFNYILVHNVGGGGDVAAVAIKGDKTDWYYMSQNWGQFWSASANVVGQALSFKVTLGSGESMVFTNVASSDWKFGQTFEADGNFN